MMFLSRLKKISIIYKVTLPIFIGSIIILFLTFFALERILFENTKTSISEKAAILIHSLDQIALIEGNSPKLLRIIKMLGAARNIKEITIAYLDDMEIINSTDSSKIGQRLELFSQEAKTSLLNNQKFSEIKYFEKEAYFYSFLRVREKDKLIDKKAAVFIKMDISSILDKSLNEQIIVGTLVFLCFILLLLLQLYLQRNNVILPLLSISDAINKRDKNNKGYAKIHYDDEIGKVAKYYNNLIDKFDNAMNDLASNQKELEAYANQLELQKFELENAMEQVKKASDLKTEFLANMSHEIRTPINGVMGMLDLISDKNLNLEEKQFLSSAKSASTILLQIINDILDFSKIEAGKMYLENIPFNLEELCKEVMGIMEHTADDKNISMQYLYDLKMPKNFKGDPVRVRQILFNLLSNAIKFTDNGSVYMNVSFLDSKKEIHISIKDTGIGMREEVLENIFNKFEQSDTSTTRKYGGTGLGLAICKDLIEMMYGEILVESEYGKGSIFNITLCLEIAQENNNKKDKDGVELKIYKNLKVLIVEDNLVNQTVAEKNLEQLGGVVSLANDGLEAIEAFKESDFDIIFMDIQMPNMDGIEATKQIRKLEKELKKQETPIIALTANVLPEEKNKCLKVGMNYYLAKPFKIKDLNIALQKIIKD